MSALNFVSVLRTASKPLVHELSALSRNDRDSQRAMRNIDVNMTPNDKRTPPKEVSTWDIWMCRYKRRWSANFILIFLFAFVFMHVTAVVYPLVVPFFKKTGIPPFVFSLANFLPFGIGFISTIAINLKTFFASDKNFNYKLGGLSIVFILSFFILGKMVEMAYGDDDEFISTRCLMYGY